MAQSDPIQCPVCEWTGHQSELKKLGSGTVCPVCGQTIVTE